MGKGCGGSRSLGRNKNFDERDAKSNEILKEKQTCVHPLSSVNVAIVKHKTNSYPHTHMHGQLVLHILDIETEEQKEKNGAVRRKNQTKKERKK